MGLLKNKLINYASDLKKLLKPAHSHRYLFFYVSKGLGLIFLIAFISLLTQVSGLYLADGILPIESLVKQIGSEKWLSWPHLFFLTSDTYILSVLWIGVLSSLALIVGLWPLVATSLCWVIYLSFVNTGSVFMSFQWDILLLEVGFLCLLGMPWVSVWKPNSNYAPPRYVIIAGYWCCFKLMFASGVVKLLSEDPLWYSCKALSVHYETQPLPHRLSWYVHQLPASLHQLSCMIMFIIELIMPILILINRKTRQIAGLSVIALMVIVMLTGNYCFFNLLTCLLALFCLDDRFFHKQIMDEAYQHSKHYYLRGIVASILLVMTVINLSSQLMPSLRPLRAITQPISGWRLSNTYGLFANMTTKRDEIEIWASIDKQSWKPYLFKDKPNSAQEIPGWTWFHQPRLDWQFWFVALRGYSQYSWTNSLITRLFEQSPAVLALFKEVPFEQAPNYIVMVKKNYQFSNGQEKKEAQSWWRVGKAEQFSPVFQKKEK
tara:strand:+ start:1166 stop:2635 length:1470 start_codon:yes stop_codon:yes gene_type:complete